MNLRPGTFLSSYNVDMLVDVMELTGQKADKAQYRTGNVLQDQNEESTLFKIHQLQLENPTRGDWTSTCQQDLKQLHISLTFNEIKNMTKSKFTSILKERISENALAYLVGKQGEKGKEIKYMSLEMSEYLQPINQNLTIEEKCEMFSIRNRMIKIPYNFPGKKNKKMSM